MTDSTTADRAPMRQTVSARDAFSAEDGDPAETAAQAIALAQVLPALKEQGRTAALEHAITFAAGSLGTRDLDDAEAAALARDASAVRRALAAEAAADAEQRETAHAQAAFSRLPGGLVPPNVQKRAIAAAGAAARLSQLARALPTGGAPEAVAAEPTGKAPGSADCTPASAARPTLSADTLRRARIAATVRSAYAALERVQPQLRAEADAIAVQLRQRAAADFEDHRHREAVRLGARVGAARRRRTRRALKLRAELHARTTPPEAAGIDQSGTAPLPPSDRAVLAWLREVLQLPLYTTEYEAAQSLWAGPDPFQLRDLPQPPDFLATVDIGNLPAKRVAPFLRRISMVKPRPSVAELSPAALDQELTQRPASLSVYVRGSAECLWGQPDTGRPPLLDPVTVIPHVVHGVWLGAPLPSGSSFWQNYGTAARHYAGRVDFVLWTDIPRERFEAARRETAGPDGQPDPLHHERALLTWAETNGIHLVNTFEVFHAQAPMTLRIPFALEMAKQLPWGYTSACDHLRVALVERFGGAYVDGDNAFLVDPSDPAIATEASLRAPCGLPHFFDEVAASLRGFTLNPIPGAGVANDIIVAPAHHPFLQLWLECARLNYSRSQIDIFGGLEAMAQPYVGHDRQWHRYIAPSRTGRVHHWVLALLGIDGTTLPLAASAIVCASELSWVALPTDASYARSVEPEHEAVAALSRCATFLRWQLIARQGDLYLTAVDPVIRTLADPDAAWTALLTELATPLAGLPSVRSITDLRRDDDGGLTRVRLPPEAEALLDRAGPPGQWLGAPLSRTGNPVWLLDEQCTPAQLRGSRSRRVPALADLTEVVVDPLGEPIGLWVREAHEARIWRYEDRFAGLPEGYLGISLGGPRLTRWATELGFCADTLAMLISGIGMATRPVLLCPSPSEAAGVAPFAERLEQLVGVPVVIRRIGEQGLIPDGAPRRTGATLARPEYLPYAEFRQIQNSQGRRIRRRSR